MARYVPTAWLAAALGSVLTARTAAAANFKKAPGADKDSGSPFNFEFDPGLEGDAALHFETAKEFLVNNYGYLGVVFVLLCLFLFGRGSKAARSKADGRRRVQSDDPAKYYDVEDLDDLLEDNSR